MQVVVGAPHHESCCQELRDAKPFDGVSRSIKTDHECSAYAPTFPCHRGPHRPFKIGPTSQHTSPQDITSHSCKSRGAGCRTLDSALICRLPAAGSAYPQHLPAAPDFTTYRPLDSQRTWHNVITILRLTPISSALILQRPEQMHLLSSPIATGRIVPAAVCCTMCCSAGFVPREQADLPAQHGCRSYSQHVGLTSATFRWSAGSAAAMFGSSGGPLAGDVGVSSIDGRLSTTYLVGSLKLHRAPR